MNLLNIIFIFSCVWCLSVVETQGQLLCQSGNSTIATLPENLFPADMFSGSNALKTVNCDGSDSACFRFDITMPVDLSGTTIAMQSSFLSCGSSRISTNAFCIEASSTFTNIFSELNSEDTPEFTVGDINCEAAICTNNNCNRELAVNINGQTTAGKAARHPPINLLFFIVLMYITITIVH